MFKKLKDKSGAKSKLSVFTPWKTQALSLRKQAIIGTIAVATLAISLISEARLAKKQLEILKIQIEHELPVCEQYALIVVQAGNFPCHECESGEIYLNFGDTWRYGVAGMGGQKGRYPGKVFYKEGKWKLTKDHLRYKMQFKGTRPECLIEEKEKIYHYPDLPEAQKREIKLIRPPGNKQDR